MQLYVPVWLCVLVVSALLQNLAMKLLLKEGLTVIHSTFPPLPPPLLLQQPSLGADSVCIMQDDVTKSKLAAYRTAEEAAKHHWSAILFVTRKMTAMGLGALFKHAPCLKAWKAATLVGYGGSVAASCLTSKVSCTSAGCH